MFPAAAHDIEFEFADNIEALYAEHPRVQPLDARRGRLRRRGPDVPAALHLARRPRPRGRRSSRSLMAQGADRDPDQVRSRARRARQPLRWPLARRSRCTTGSGHIVNEAGIRLAVHLGGTDYQKYGADWSRGPRRPSFGDFDAFQWMMYWGDRPAMELTAGLILHNFFGRFPNINVCLSEQGTVWLPYTLRKMDHAFLMGRKAKWAETAGSTARPTRSSASTSSWRRSRKRTCSGWWPRSASSRSCSAPTSPTAKASPSPREYAARSSSVQRRREAHHARQPRALPPRRLIRRAPVSR